MKRPLIRIGIIILFLSFLSYHSFWYIMLHNVPDKIKSPVKSVVRAYYLSKITGGYWENEMEQQHIVLATQNIELRVAFYQKILLTIESLDTSKAYAFTKIVGDDANELQSSLMSLKESSKFSNLSTTQQKEVIAWIASLSVIVKQQRQTRSPIKEFAN